VLSYEKFGLNLMREGFVTAPFDLPAASRFAILWNERQQNNVIRDLQQIHKATREELKVDCLIVATALAREAACIYSHDVKLKTFAGESIQVLELPVGEEQMNLI
jgi:hypothetical protein